MDHVCRVEPRLLSRAHQVMHKKYTPSGNFSPKRGNKNFYKGKGGNKYGKSDKHGARAHARLSAPLCPPLQHFTWVAPSLCGPRQLPASATGQAGLEHP